MKKLWARLSTRTKVSIGFLIVSMVVFPLGLLSDNTPLSTTGWVIFTVGVLIDRRKPWAIPQNGYRVSVC